MQRARGPPPPAPVDPLALPDDVMAPEQPQAGAAAAGGASVTRSAGPSSSGPVEPLDPAASPTPPLPKSICPSILCPSFLAKPRSTPLSFASSPRGRRQARPRLALPPSRPRRWPPRHRWPPCTSHQSGAPRRVQQRASRSRPAAVPACRLPRCHRWPPPRSRRVDTRARRRGTRRPRRTPARCRPTSKTKKVFEIRVVPH